MFVVLMDFVLVWKLCCDVINVISFFVKFMLDVFRVFDWINLKLEVLVLLGIGLFECVEEC